MNCLNREEILAYVDDELKGETFIRTETHIKDCAKCSIIFEQVHENRLFIQQIFNDHQSSYNHINIPSFQKPPKRKLLTKVWPYLAAASIAILFFILPLGKKDQSIPVDTYTNYINADYNQLWHDMDQMVLQEIQNELMNFVSPD